MLGFCIPGYLASLWRANLKHGFWIAFIVLGLSLWYLLSVTTLFGAYLAMLLWGVGQGIFWLTINTFELSETRQGERDFYSSMLNAGGQVLNLLGPAAATLFIWLAGVWHLPTFSLLFLAAPFIYLLGLFCFGSIEDYRPPKLVWADVRHFFAGRANHAAQLYTAGTGTQQLFAATIVPVATLLILGTALRVGIYDTIFALFAAVCVFVFAQYRNERNRLTLFALSTAVIAIATAWLGVSLTFGALIIYTAAVGLFSPVKNVSSHVIDLAVMETGREGTDFYATMLLRDFFLWIWRSLGGLAFLAFAAALGAQREVLSAGLYALAAALVLTYGAAALFVKTRA
jgi:hypothetical protein